MKFLGYMAYAGAFVSVVAAFGPSFIFLAIGLATAAASLTFAYKVWVTA